MQYVVLNIPKELKQSKTNNTGIKNWREATECCRSGNIS